MKLLIATGIYPPTVGGPATYAKLLNDELPKRNISVQILSFEKFLKYPKFISQGLYFLKLLTKAYNSDIIYALDPVTVGFPAKVASRILRKKFVVRIAGDRAWEQGTQQFGVTDTLDDFVKDRVEYHPQVMRIKALQWGVARVADKIIVPSRYLKKIIAEWGINESKIVVVYNSFDVAQDESFEVTENSNSEQIGDVLTIMSAGRLVSWKGFETLISIMPNLLEKFPNLNLIIAGDGPQKEKLKSLIEEYNLNNKVKLTGSLSKQDLFENIKKSDVFVLNTAYEGFSHQILEVLYLETPIVTTNVGGNPEIIIDGENGLLVEYNDRQALEVAIEKILTDQEFSKALSKNGKNSVAKYNKEKMLVETINELNSVL